jgi:hypothetical protein
MNDKRKIKILKGMVLGYAALTLATGYLARKVDAENRKLKKVTDLQLRIIKRYSDLSDIDVLKTVKREFEFEAVTISIDDKH